MVRRSIKSLFETLAASYPARRLARPRLNGRVLVLAYHNVLPPDARPRGERSLHLPLDDFRRQLDHLRETHEVLPLARTLGPPSDRPAVAITFDDAYQSALQSGLPEASARGLPVTVFVAPGLLGREIPWWDAIADSGSGLLDPALRQHAISALSGDTDRILRWAGAGGLPVQAACPATRIATESELEKAAQLEGVTLGAHSWSHPSLPDIPGDEMSRELARPLEWLQARFGAVLPVLAYPYGRASPSVREATRVAGYVAALGIAGGWFRPALADPMQIPRFNVPAGLSLRGFAARVSGVLG